MGGARGGQWLHGPRRSLNLEQEGGRHWLFSSSTPMPGTGPWRILGVLIQRQPLVRGVAGRGCNHHDGARARTRTALPSRYAASPVVPGDAGAGQGQYLKPAGKTTAAAPVRAGSNRECICYLCTSSRDASFPARCTASSISFQARYRSTRYTKRDAYVHKQRMLDNRFTLEESINLVVASFD